MVCAAIVAAHVLTLGAQEPAFEVASVKPNRSTELRIQMDMPGGGRFTAINVPLRELIRFAYDVQDARLSGGPDWIQSERFDIVARADHELPACVDFSVAWNRGGSASSSIDEDGVIGAFSEKFAPIFFQVPNQRPPLHALTLNGSRISSAPAAASSINSRFACRTISTAS